jgi:hypothetical protein
MDTGLAPRGWYEPWEFVIKSWQDLLVALEFVLESEDRNYFWRGQSDSRWGLTTSMHRQLLSSSLEPNKIVIESDVSTEEQRLLIAAYMEWRLDSQEPFEFFLKLQHMGGASRLLDVSKSPLIAAWFACSEETSSNLDGRLFGFGLNPNLSGRPQFDGVEGKWPFTKHYSDTSQSLSKKNEFLLWEPPHGLDYRITTQQSAFLLGHTPSLGDYLINTYKKHPTAKKEYWAPKSVLRATNLHVNFTEAWKRMNVDWEGRSAYTMRIKAKAKPEILRNLRRIAGIYDATLFPTIEGFNRRLGAVGRDPFALVFDRNFDLD